MKTAIVKAGGGVSRVTPEATSVNTMWAFGITAPDLSSTVPVSVAVPFCATATYPGRKASTQARPQTKQSGFFSLVRLRPQAPAPARLEVLLSGN